MVGTSVKAGAAGQGDRQPGRNGRPRDGGGAATPAFGIMARTDALAFEGPERTIERAAACVEAGADMTFRRP